MAKPPEPYEPNEDEIAALTAAIRRGWSPRQHQVRAGLDPHGRIETRLASVRTGRVPSTIGRD